MHALCMCACMHICMYICMCVYMCVSLYVCVCMYVCMYVCVYVCTYIRMYVCMHVCMYVCVCTHILQIVECQVLAENNCLVPSLHAITNIHTSSLYRAMYACVCPSLFLLPAQYWDCPPAVPCPPPPDSPTHTHTHTHTFYTLLSSIRQRFHPNNKIKNTFSQLIKLDNSITW